MPLDTPHLRCGLSDRLARMEVILQLVLAVLALVHITYGCPGTARTSILIGRKYH